MPHVSYYPNGITNGSPDSDLGDLQVPDPTKLYKLFEEFTYYDGGEWSINGPLSAALLANSVDGALELTQSSVTPGAFENSHGTFFFEVGKQSWFKIGLFTTTTSAELDSSSIVFGLIFDASNQVGFKYDGTKLIGRIEIAGTNTDVDLFDTTSLFPTENVLQEFAFHYDGESRISFYVDNILQGSTVLDADSLASTSLMVFSIELSPAGASAVVLDIDYIYIAQER